LEGESGAQVLAISAGQSVLVNGRSRLLPSFDSQKPNQYPSSSGFEKPYVDRSS